MWLDEVIATLGKKASSLKADGNVDLVRLGHCMALAELATVRDDPAYLDNAKAVLEPISDPRRRAEGLATLVRQRARYAARHQDAADLDLAITLANTISHPYFRAMATIELAIVAASVGDHRQAKHSLGVANEWIYTIRDEQQRAVALMRISEALAEVGASTSRPELVGYANGISHQISNLEKRARALAAVGSAYGQLGMQAEVTTALQRGVGCLPQITDPYEQVLAMGDVATLHARATTRLDPHKLPEEAVLLIRRAEALVDEIPDPFGRSSALYSLTGQLLELGALKEGQRLAGAALDHALSVTDPYHRGQAFAQLAGPMARLEELYKAHLLIEVAAQIADEIKDEYFRAQLIHQLLVTLPQLLPSAETVTTYLARMERLVDHARKKGADIHESHSTLRNAKESLAQGEVERAGDLAVRVNGQIERLIGITTNIPKVADGGD